MGFKHHPFGNVVVNYWHGAVSLAEVQLSMEKARLAHQMYGPLTGITILGRDLERPTMEIGGYMAANRMTMLSYHRSMHMVVPKGSPKAVGVSMYILTSLTLGTRHEIAQHPTVQVALEDAEKVRQKTMGLMGFTTPKADILGQLERLKVPLT
ncbi:hypothetical protein M0Q28_03770 [Patescibacteria group bacterium]|jgi:hypothetical protein|nr:hypothetical protein [Patescibacteria group bacterium]